MTEEANKQPPRLGYGFYPVPEIVWRQRHADVSELMAAFDSRTTPEWSEELAASIKRMSGILREVSRQIGTDWFTVSSLFSHPSPSLAAKQVFGLGRLLQELDRDRIDGINTALEKLEGAYLPQMLEHYLQSAGPEGPDALASVQGWVYFLSSPSDPSLILAGATKGEISDVIGEANSANPGMREFGVVAAWRVTNPDAAADLVADELSYRYLDNGYYSSSSARDLREMKQGVSDTLSARNLIIGNPMWKPREKKSLMQIDIYSEVKNKHFKADVDGVFEAFRR